MNSSFMNRLDAVRRDQFVGRQKERDLIKTALVKEETPFFLLYVFGSGGVGKSSLLREAGYMASQLQIPVYLIDGRNIEPSPVGFLGTLQQILGLSNPDLIFEHLGTQDGRVLIIIDTAELLSPLDSWLRDSFLPQLPGNVVVIIAGRTPPSLSWRTDAGWQQLMQILPLQNLSQEESRAFVMRRNIPAKHHNAILHFTHGHPLALSLVADVITQQPEEVFQPEDAPDIIKTLLEQFIQEVPSDKHRTALEMSSQVRLLTEPLLSVVLQVEDAHAIFEWLRTLSFIESDRRGLFPHDLAREALAADLRWRDPKKQGELHEKARSFYMKQFLDGTPRQQRQTLSDYIFLHRDNPVISSYFDWQSSGVVFTDWYQKKDRKTVIGMIRRHEGKTAAQLAEHWLKQHPEKMVVFRQPDGNAVGLLLVLSLEKCRAEDRALDPAVASAWAYLAKRAPLRPNETATLFRFWMADETYQDVSPVQSRIFLNMVQHYLTTPGLAFTMIPCTAPDDWTDIFSFADLHRLPEAEFEVEGHTFGVFGHDWRVVPPMIWLANMAEKELGITINTPAETVIPTTLPVFEQKEFAAAVHEALRHFTDELGLQTNPLLRSRFLLSSTGANAPQAELVKQLRTFLSQGVQTMQDHPKQIKWQRAVYHTYIQPAATQEKAAEILDLPFSTYRRHLRSGIKYVTDWLWAQELNQ